MTPKKQPVVFAFIDSQNFNLGARSQGWAIDYKKFRLYLKNKYKMEKAFMFIGLVAYNQKLYTKLQEAGFILVFKPTIQYFENGKETVKGNVDAELVLHAAAIEYRNYDQAIIVSGDGDFRYLIEFLLDNNKLLTVMAPNRFFSKLLREFSSYIIRIDRLKKELAYKKRRDRRSVETLGLPGHGDTKKTIATRGQKVNTRSKGKRRVQKEQTA